MSVTPVVYFVSFSLYELLYDLLWRRVCDVPVVPQVLISLLYIDSYASVYGMIEVLRGSGNPMPFDYVA